MVVADFLRSDTEVAEHLVQLLAEVTKGNGAMVREVLFYQHMAVESAHLRDGKDANRAEGAGCYRQHLALCDVSAQLIVGGALQAEEGDGTGDNVALEGALCDLLRQRTRHNHLVFHLAEGELSGSGVAAVEAHKDVLVLVWEFCADVLLV